MPSGEEWYGIWCVADTTFFDYIFELSWLIPKIWHTLKSAKSRTLGMTDHQRRRARSRRPDAGAVACLRRHTMNTNYGDASAGGCDKYHNGAFTTGSWAPCLHYAYAERSVSTTEFAETSLPSSLHHRATVVIADRSESGRARFGNVHRPSHAMLICGLEKRMAHRLRDEFTHRVGTCCGDACVPKWEPAFAHN